MSLTKILKKIIREEYDDLVLENKLREGLISWAGGVADNVLYSVLNNYRSIRQTDIFKDPKIRRLAKDLKMDQKELEKRVATLATKDKGFLRALATQRYVRPQ